MLEHTATAYISRLSELMLTTEVTERSGCQLSLDEGSTRAVQMILDAGLISRKVMLAGNGGSAAVVSHVQNDLCKAVGIPALVFTEQPLMTALANDDGYETIFEKPLEMWAQQGDLVITVSSSGRSENIVRALKSAAEKGCNTITFSGFDPDNTSRLMGDLNFYVASYSYGYVETAHAGITHFLTDMARDIKLARNRS